MKCDSRQYFRDSFSYFLFFFLHFFQIFTYSIILSHVHLTFFLMTLFEFCSKTILFYFFRSKVKKKRSEERKSNVMTSKSCCDWRNHVVFHVNSTLTPWLNKKWRERKKCRRRKTWARVQAENQIKRWTTVVKVTPFARQTIFFCCCLTLSQNWAHTNISNWLDHCSISRENIIMAKWFDFFILIFSSWRFIFLNSFFFQRKSTSSIRPMSSHLQWMRYTKYIIDLEYNLMTSDTNLHASLLFQFSVYFSRNILLILSYLWRSYVRVSVITLIWTFCLFYDFYFCFIFCVIFFVIHPQKKVFFSSSFLMWSSFFIIFSFSDFGESSIMI